MTAKGKVIQNWVLMKEKKEGKKTAYRYVGVNASKIFLDIKRHVGDWPKAVGDAIYIVQEGEIVREIRHQTTFFAWLAACGITVEWKNNCNGSISRDVFFQFVKLTCSRYYSIETIPHYPRLDKVHYELEPEPTGIYQGTLTTLLNMFCPDSPLDLVYLRAMFLTPVWGGRGGARPAFVILGPEVDTNKGGRGVGKSTLTDILALLYGNSVDFSPDADLDNMSKRILTTKGRRLVKFDNVRKKMSGQAFESMITAWNISGHQMYCGDGNLPNFFTWIITFNQPDFSTDMAQRAIPIRLGRPKYDPDWEDNVEAYVKANRWKIICDCIRILKDEPKCTLNSHIRFARWSKDVLSRCTVNKNITSDIEKRQSAVEHEEKEIDRLYDIIDMRLSEYTFAGGMAGTTSDLDKCCYRVRQSLLAKWIRDEMPWLNTSRLMRILDVEKPDWLTLPENYTSNKDGGRVLMGPKIRGTHYLEIGRGTCPRAWVVDVDSRRNNMVRNDVRRKCLEVAPE